MKELKNKEVRTEVFLNLLVFVVLLSVVVYIIESNLYFSFFEAVLIGVFTISAALFSFILIRSHFAEKADKRLAAISESIDAILHGENKLFNDIYDEGELGILSSEVEKLTIMLKEKSDRLYEDKVYLKDSISDIFHQLRTPLTSINLAMNFLSYEDISYEKRIQYIRDIKRQLDRMHWLVEALLKLSKIDAGTAVFAKEKVNVKELIKASAEPFVIPMELKNVKFVMNCNEEIFTGDFAWSAEAFSNLIKNAFEHTSEGGIITVDAEETPIYTKITVRDNGEGFYEEDIPNLFKRFYKGKNATSTSIGIGLALTRAIITEQNGTISAANAKEGGAEFTVKIYKTNV